MTNREAISLYNALDGLNYRGVKFAYTVARNLNILKPIMNAMDKALAISPAFTEYEKARVALAKEHAEKDAAGKPKVEGDNFVILDMPKFDKALATLRETHKAAIDTREKQLKEYKELQDEEVSVDLYTIHQGLLPNDISTHEMTAIFPIIEHEDPIVSPLSKEMAAKPGKKGKNKGK